MLNEEKQGKAEIRYEDIMTDEFKAEIIFKSSREGLKLLRVGIIITIIFSLFIFACAIEQSMEPTIYENDIVVYISIIKNLKRGDIIVFFPENSKHLYCKRIIGIPNDTIEFTEEGEIRINGVLLKENYVLGPTFSNDFEDKIIVPEGQYYVLGDNRCISTDSRYFGPIIEEQIKGKLILRIPTSKIIKKSHPSIYED